MSIDVERTSDEIIIRLPLDSLPDDVQDVLDYFRYIELGKSNVITDDDVRYFVEKSRGAWWKSNRERFVGKPGFERFE